MLPPPLVDENGALREKLISRRQKLAGDGLTDWGIARVLAKEFGMTPKALEGRLKTLRRNGTIDENPNRQEKKSFPREALIEARQRLAGEGLCDGAIAARISESSGRPVGSLKSAISALIKEGALEPNPNAQKEIERNEYAWIRRRRGELCRLGLSDTSISRVLAAEGGSRNAEAVRRAIWDLVRMGALEKNSPGGNAGYERIIIRREELIREGMGDCDIAKTIADERGNRVDSVRLLIYRAVHNGGCRPNPN